MSRTYAIGYDFGNSDTCIVVDGMRHSMPSATSLGMYQTLKSHEGFRMEKDYYVYRDADTECYVGKLALDQSTVSSTGRGDSTRYWGTRSKHLLLTSSAAIISDTEYNLVVVTGLPVKTYTESQDARKKVKDALEGEHIFSINGKQRIAHVKVAKVIMEGAGANIKYGLSDKVMQAVIDIGGRTTDLYASYGQTPQTNRCNGIDIGVENAADLLDKLFFASYGSHLDAREKRECMHAYAQKKKLPLIYRKSEETHYREMLQAAIRTTGVQIAEQISALWEDTASGSVASNYAQVLLIGGGAYYFQDQVRQRIPNIKIAPCPECANAYGYAQLAQVNVESQYRAA